MKNVSKPWGKEVWLELNDRYCYKRIYINAGHRTSYQYHNYKLETNYIISGTAEIWLENSDGVLEKTIMKSGDFFTVYPPRKHRVIAITDIVLQEVSTPEVNDVIRISDDTDRPDGLIEREHQTPVMCILAAGLGTRMGFLSKILPKCLLPINNKAIISHIIDKTPIECEIVIAVGYKSDLIKQYCQITHSDRKITFIDVDDFTSEKSGPGYSMMSCKKLLQRPFYLVVSDSFITDKLPPLDGNWMGIYKTGLPEKYSTVLADGKNIVDFKNKSVDGYEDAFIGICSIVDYDIFWNKLEQNILDTGEVVSAFYDVLDYKKITTKVFDWYDIGTLDDYLKTKLKFEDDKLGLLKSNGQFIYKIDNRIIKLFTENTTNNLLSRYNIISEFTPKILNHSQNIISYDWVSGRTLYEINKVEVWSDFLTWAKSNLWKEEKVDISSDCKIFYENKTKDRFNRFKMIKGDSYFHDTYVINNIKYNNLVDKIDFSIFENGIATKYFHGDLQFDNILYGQDKNFYLIDWRENFGSSTEYGDVYYDLAKLYGGMKISYSLMKNKNNFNFTKFDNYVTYYMETNTNLIKFIEHFENWCNDNNYNLIKIKKITALIYLNMSPLHSDGFDDILYFECIKLLNEI